MVKNINFFWDSKNLFLTYRKTVFYTLSMSFFLGGIFLPILKKKNWALLSKNVQAIFPLYNLAQKVLFLEDLKKKVSESDWNQIHIVYVTQIHYYTWF